MSESTLNFYKEVVSLKTEYKGQTELHYVAEKNNLPEVERLLSEGADVNAQDFRRQTPLHYAVIFDMNSDHFQVIELLLSRGADVNAQDDEAKSPLHYQVWHNSVRTTQLLLNFGANVNVKDLRGETPLFNAMRDGNLEVADILLENGSNVNAVNSLRCTVLHVAGVGELRVVKYLFKKGINVNRVNCEGHIAPVWMLRNSTSTKMSRFLLKYVDFSLINQAIEIVPYNVINRNYWVIILKQLAKLRAKGVQLPRNLLQTLFGRDMYRTYFSSCTQELEATKAKIGNTSVSFYNLLVDSKRMLKDYAGDKDVVEGFKGSDCERFPIFGADIKENFDKGVKRRKFFDQAAVKLSGDLPIFSHDHPVIRELLDRLTMSDYVRLTSVQ